MKVVFTMSTMQHQCNVHGAMFTTQCSRRKVIFDEILCWVDNCRQPYNALPTGNQDIVSSLAQWGAHTGGEAQARGVISLTGESVYSANSEEVHWFPDVVDHRRL